MSPVAEPAAGWTKALAAAAVIVAGGAGVAAHHDGPSAGHSARAATKDVTITAAPAARHHQRVVAAPVVRHHRTTAPARPAAKVSVRGKVNRTSGAPSGVKVPATPARATPPVRPAHLATPPSASAVEPDSPPAGGQVLTPDTGAASPVPVIGPVVDQVESVVTQANGPTGRAVSGTTDGLTGILGD